MTFGIFGKQDQRVGQSVNSEYQTKKTAEGSQGDYKRIYEEYDEGEQSRTQVDGHDRHTHYIRVHKPNEHTNTTNQTQIEGVSSNSTSSGTPV